MVAPTPPSPAPTPPSESGPAIAAPPSPVPLDTSDSSRFAPILAALISGQGLAKIITKFHLSAEDLHALLNTPGLPERLLAARAVARLDDEFRTLAARARATDHLLHLIDTAEDTTEDRVESRRAATAILKGPLAIPRPTPASVKTDGSGGARLDVSDWAAPGDQDDAELDEDVEDPAANTKSAHAHPPHVASTGGGVRGSRSGEPRTEGGVPVSEPAPLPQDLPRPALSLTPDQLVAHQLSVIQTLDKPSLTPHDLYMAIDYHRLAFPNRYYAAKALAFKNNLINNPLLNIQGAQITAHPALLHDTTPPTATVKVTITRPPAPAPAPARAPAPADAQCLMPDASCSSSCLFHLIHESTFFPDPARPHAWHTRSITKDDSG